MYMLCFSFTSCIYNALQALLILGVRYTVHAIDHHMIYFLLLVIYSLVLSLPLLHNTYQFRMVKSKWLGQWCYLNFLWQDNHWAIGNCAFNSMVFCFSVYRKCKLTTTGPWQEVPPIPLSDVTILPCAPMTTVEQVPLWAISNKGDVLCRLGVTSLTPAVRYHLLLLKHTFWLALLLGNSVYSIFIFHSRVIMVNTVFVQPEWLHILWYFKWCC